MKTKKRTRLISLFLAVVMAVSALTASLSAQAAYKPTYGEKATEEDFALMIEDVNTILDDTVLTGDTIEAIYKMLPSLHAAFNNGQASGGSNTISYYINHDAERWGALADYVDEGTTAIIDDVTNEDGTTTPGTFSKFFEDHPIVCETQADFKAEVDYIIELAVDANLVSIIAFAFSPFMGGDSSVGIAFCEGLDEICAALGIQQEATAGEALGIPSMAGDEAKTETYLKNIVAAILPDAANSVLNIIRTVSNDANAADLYSGVTKILNNLNATLSTISNAFGGLIDMSAITDVLTTIVDVWSRIPTTGEGDAKMIDVNQLIAFVCNEAGLGIVTSLIKFPEINLENVSGTETNADLVKTVYDYIYNTLIGDAGNNAKLKGVIQDPTGEGSILEGALGTELPVEVENALLSAFDMSNDDMANDLIVTVAELAGRQIEEPSTEDPSENPSEDPTNPGTEDPSENPSEDPTKDDTTTTTAGGNKLPNANTDNPNLPNTGRTYDALTAVSMIICLSAAAALVVVLLSSKKKVTE